MITGDLGRIGNFRLRKLMTKDPNYREPRTLNLNKALNNVNSGINNYIQDLSK